MAITMVVLASLSAPAFCYEIEESNDFFAGLQAYQQRKYADAVNKFRSWIQAYPESTLRDLGIYWLARSHFQAGNQQDGVTRMSQFLQEFPGSPLVQIIDKEIRDLANRSQRGERLAATPPAKELFTAKSDTEKNKNKPKQPASSL